MSTTTLDTEFTCAQSAEGKFDLPGYFAWKGVIDRVLALMLLVPGLPLIGCLVVLVRLTSRGPGIFSQVRTGRGGTTFTMYKMRSMRVDAESATGAVWCVGNDPRITPLGYYLRKLHLDELPQLFNVLRGEMSLIGPRPERPEFVCVLAEQIAGYEDRLAVLPGVTGLAQINLPADTDLDSVRRKQMLDLEYIRTASLGLDLRMLVCTMLRLVGIKGDIAMRVMKLQRTVVLPASGDEPKASDAEVEAVTPDVLNRSSDVLRETMTWKSEDTAETSRIEVDAALADVQRGKPR